MSCSSWVPQVASFFGSGGLSPIINSIAPSDKVPALESFESLGTSDLGRGQNIGSAGFNWTDQAMGTEKSGLGGAGLSSQLGSLADTVATSYFTSGAGDFLGGLLGGAGDLFGLGTGAAEGIGEGTAYTGMGSLAYAPSTAEYGMNLSPETFTGMGEIPLGAYGNVTPAMDTMPMGNDFPLGAYGNVTPSADTGWGASSDFPLSNYGNVTNASDVGWGGDGGDDWWNAIKKFGGKNKLPLGMMAMGLLGNTAAKPRENAAIANSLQDYFNQKWTPESRNAMMQGVLGQTSGDVAAAKRKLGASAAAAGRGGGAYGSATERAQEQARETAATQLSKTFAPTNFDQNAYINLAKAQTGSNWYDTLLQSMGQMGGQWPYAALMNMYGGNKDGGI
jgi:hypothetical protein